jgi:hypothetical protein
MSYQHGEPNGSMTTADEPVHRSKKPMMTPHGCDHPKNDIAELVCAHLLDVSEPDYYRWYTGDGPQYALVCSACAADGGMRATALHSVCPVCFAHIAADGSWDGNVGVPGILERQTNLRFEHQDVALPDGCTGPLRAIIPVDASARFAWVAITAGGKLVQLDLQQGTIQFLATFATAPLQLDEPLTLQLSPDGRLAAVANIYGRFGQVVDLTTGAPTMALDRGDYHEDVSKFPLAFFTYADRPLLVHATDWNRLDISDPLTGALLTPRQPTSYQHGEPRPEHYLDYFHCGLSVSPNQEWIVDNGWVWHPWGIVRSWNLPRWRETNYWESEDGSSIRSLCDRSYLWDAPLCWIDNTTLAVWGEGRDDEEMVPAALIFDVVSGERLRWFAGPDVAPYNVWPPNSGRRGWMVSDRWLFAVSPQHGTGIWDVVSGERLHHDPDCIPTMYHRGARHFLTLLSDRTIRLSTLVVAA